MQKEMSPWYVWCGNMSLKDSEQTIKIWRK